MSYAAAHGNRPALACLPSFRHMNLLHSLIIDPAKNEMECPECGKRKLPPCSKAKPGQACIKGNEQEPKRKKTKSGKTITEIPMRETDDEYFDTVTITNKDGKSVTGNKFMLDSVWTSHVNCN